MPRAHQAKFQTDNRVTGHTFPRDRLAEIEFMGEMVGGTILFAESDAEPLPGVIAWIRPVSNRSR